MIMAMSVTPSVPNKEASSAPVNVYPEDTAEPESFDNLFIDDDEEGDLFDDGSFTMIEKDDFNSSPSFRPDVDPHHHFRRQHQQQEPNTADKMKGRIKAFWHSVKYGWSESVKPKTNFKKKKSIFLLSKHYKCDSENGILDEKQVARVITRFKQDFTSRIWLTYRQGFPYITDTQITSDSGWGCMLRSAQMMLAQALVLHYLGRDWNMFSKQSSDTETFHREIIRWFADQPSQTSPFSIHRLVNIGKGIGRKPGDWFGPASAATVLEKACHIALDFVPLLQDVCLYVAHDCTIYKQDLLDLATSGATGHRSSISSLSESWKSVIIIVPVRLGTENLNPIYIPCLKGLFCLDSFLGIIGGKPRHSLYFIGFQENKLIHLDPHIIQETVDTSQRDFPLQSYHCCCPRKLSFESMDPSCALGFYCRTQNDFETFVKRIPPYLIPPDDEHNYPMFVITEGSRTTHYKTTGYS